MYDLRSHAGYSGCFGFDVSARVRVHVRVHVHVHVHLHRVNDSSRPTQFDVVWRKLLPTELTVRTQIIVNIGMWRGMEPAFKSEGVLFLISLLNVPQNCDYRRVSTRI